MAISDAIRILVADDHAIVRTGFRQFVCDEPDMEVAAEAASGEEVVTLVREREFDVVLLDIAMPDTNGIDTLRVVKQIKPRLPVLFLSTYPETQYAVILLRAGADGYVMKDAPPEEIIRAIRTVARGHRYVSEVTAGLLMQKLERPGDQAMHDGLSDREFQVFCKLAQGRKPTEIAEELHLSVKTISTYRARVLEKMRLQSNAELTRYALENGLIL
ncbi:two component LuxR family transcriptional regulator [Pandoraea thiooxydans]|uniref:LuxR family transcriptional regulator n=1 Tax=Pandoraea thiooxydans TaxID=445709 RepID=A0A0G3ET49_9BURK|nr:response regulator transcription factor [Pandoraea thiooxydans]AKJ70130.1 DNA-binding response regulator [Pandoraea thiooxydans]APR93563.1 two component LuxR family transcriptional regulator [Pandoraea thiooxydans]